MRVDRIYFFFSLPSNSYFNYNPFSKKFVKINNTVCNFNLFISIKTFSECILNYGSIPFTYTTLEEYDTIIETLRLICTDNKYALIYFNDNKEENKNYSGLAKVIIKDFPDDKKEYYYYSGDKVDGGKLYNLESIIKISERINW